MRRGLIQYSFALSAALLGVLVGDMAVQPAASQPVAAPTSLSDYEAQDVMIPMRDGVRLHAQVWRPKGHIGKLPTQLSDPL